jgi:zinc transport system substrate-binding protein
LTFSSCSRDYKGTGKSDAGELPIIAVSILPHSYFVQRIGGDKVSVLVLVGSGQSPHSFEPSPKQLAELSRAKAWILSNTEFEQSLAPKVASLYPALAIVDGTAGVKFRPMEAHAHEDEEDGHVEETSGVNIDRHSWLGREPAKLLATQVRGALVKADPAHEDFYEENYRAFIADIDREFDSLIPLLAPLKGKSVFVYHPAFGYFLDEFGIGQEAVETGGKEPTAKALAELIAKAREDRASVIFVQAQFPVNAAKTVASSVGATVVPLDDLSPDWLNNIRLMGDALKKAAEATR